MPFPWFRLGLTLAAAWLATACSGFAQTSTSPADGGGADSQSATSPATRAVPPTEEQIRTAIRELNHPSPGRRREAVRQLAEWGPLAFNELGRVAAGPDLEPALLARDLLREMGEVLFVGGRVRLEANRTRIRWDQPFNLVVHVDNPTPGAVRVPWPAGLAALPADAKPAVIGRFGGEAIVDDAIQVSAMMDIADYLMVVGPDGQEVELRVDPIEQDTAVFRAVTRRAGDQPPSHAIPAETSERLVVLQFNRGWARYPLLAAGTYIVRFAYQPQWKDPAWVDQGFGLIESNSLAIDVIESAPAEIRRAARPIQLELRREGGQVIGELQNVWDRELWLNLNIGGAIETHARLVWCPQTREGEPPDPFGLESDATDPQFSADRLKRLAAGEKVIVSKADVDDLLERGRAVMGNADGGPHEQLTVILKYTHIPTAQDLREALRSKGIRESVPCQLFSGSAISEPITLRADAQRP